MMDMGDMADRCMNAMGTMIGGGLTGNGMMLVVLLAFFVLWLLGLAATGVVIFWGVRKLSRPHA